MIEKIKAKIKCKQGGGLIYAASILMFGMLLISIGMEYFRIRVTALGIQSAYEKAILTVATENYNETYTGVREEEALGGIYEGGNETVRNSTNAPEWIPMHDYGAVIDELMDLLELEGDGGTIAKIINGKKEYELRDFEIEVKNQMDSSIDRYEVRGKAKLKMPFYFCGEDVTDVNLKLSVSSAYTSKYQ